MKEEYVDNNTLKASLTYIMQGGDKWFRVRTLTNTVNSRLTREINPRKLSRSITLMLNNMIANGHVIRIKKGEVYLYKWKRED